MYEPTGALQHQEDTACAVTVQYEMRFINCFVFVLGNLVRVSLIYGKHLCEDGRLAPKHHGLALAHL